MRTRSNDRRNGTRLITATDARVSVVLGTAGIGRVAQTGIVMVIARISIVDRIDKFAAIAISIHGKRYASPNLIAQRVSVCGIFASKQIDFFLILIGNFIDSEFHVLAVTDTSQLLVMGGSILNIRARKLSLRDSAAAGVFLRRRTRALFSRVRCHVQFFSRTCYSCESGDYALHSAKSTICSLPRGDGVISAYAVALRWFFPFYSGAACRVGRTTTL